MNMVLVISKSRKKVLYAECEEDFVNFLFSFLVFPLGFVLKLLGGKSSLGCFDSLYKSISDLSTDEYFKPQSLKDMLLSPKIAPNFACENQLLDVEESQYNQSTDGIVSPGSGGSNSGELMDPSCVTNPNCSARETTQYGGSVKGPTKYMITDDLIITMLSPAANISLLLKFNVAFTDVKEIAVQVGQKEGKDLLRASWICESLLTNVFHKTFPVSTDVE